MADLFAGPGLFAGLVGDVVGPTGSVLAVERDRWACADATRNTFDQPHVEVLRAAVTSALVSERLGWRGSLGARPVAGGRWPAGHELAGGSFAWASPDRLCRV